MSLLSVLSPAPRWLSEPDSTVALCKEHPRVLTPPPGSFLRHLLPLLRTLVIAERPLGRVSSTPWSAADSAVLRAVRTLSGAAGRCWQAAGPSSVLCSVCSARPEQSWVRTQPLRQDPQECPTRRGASRSLVLRLDQKEDFGLFHFCSTQKSGSYNVTWQRPAPRSAPPCCGPCRLADVWPVGSGARFRPGTWAEAGTELHRHQGTLAVRFKSLEIHRGLLSSPA